MMGTEKRVTSNQSSSSFFSFFTTGSSSLLKKFFLVVLFGCKLLLDYGSVVQRLKSRQNGSQGAASCHSGTVAVESCPRTAVTFRPTEDHNERFPLRRYATGR